MNGLACDITALQEIWQHQQGIKEKWDILDIITRPSGRGGGTATLIQDPNQFLVQKKIQINKDSNMLRIRIKNNYFWFCNIYLHEPKITKLQKLMGKVLQYVPQNELSQVIILGDFNIDLNPRR